MTHAFTDEERRETMAEFHRVVNMGPDELGAWLDGHDSRSVGMTPDGERVTDESDGESVGHAMGRRILHIGRTPRDRLTDEDYADMRKVIGYVHRHMKQRPEGDVTDTRWRKSLMNWGHDPLR